MHRADMHRIMRAAVARRGDVGNRQARRIVGEDAAVRPVDRQPAYPAVEHAGHIDAVITLFEMMAERSEEHTSELQSLMRISYAVFCLKKKKKKKHNNKIKS